MFFELLTSSNAILFWIRRAIRESRYRTSRSRTKFFLDWAEILPFKSRSRFWAVCSPSKLFRQSVTETRTSSQVIFNLDVLLRCHAKESGNTVSIGVPVGHATRRRLPGRRLIRISHCDRYKRLAGYYLANWAKNDASVFLKGIYRSVGMVDVVGNELGLLSTQPQRPQFALETLLTFWYDGPIHFRFPDLSWTPTVLATKSS